MTATPPPLGTLEFFSDAWAQGIEPAREQPPRIAARPKPVPEQLRLFGAKPAEIDEVWDNSDLDWRLIKQLRSQATVRMTEERPAGHLDEETERALGQRIVDELLDTWTAHQMRLGEAPSPKLVERLAKAVMDELFELGRLQPLIDSKWIENIELHGADWTLIELIDGRKVHGPRIAETDEELIEYVRYWASRAEPPRGFTPAHPAINLPLGTRARLAAMAWVTLKPIITIRIHGYARVTLDDLVRNGTLTPLMAQFLAAAVRAGRSVVVAGAQGAGKTTLCRGLAAALPVEERIAVFETDRELHLDAMPERHPRCFSVEERSGSGEFRADGSEAGRYTIAQALADSLRHNGDRLLVGEVRGAEIIPMIQAMQSGVGSISTTHARSARDAYRKLVTCALAAEGANEAHANRAVAQAIDYIVFIKKVPDGAGNRVRRVLEIVSLGLDSDGVHFSDVFQTRPDGTVAANTTPPDVEDLIEEGFDWAAFAAEASQGAQQ